MTAQEQNIAIAEACGLRVCNCVDWGAMDHLSNCPASWQQEKNLPSYTTCLNAMHEAEATIKAPHIYNEQLEMVVLGYVMNHKDAVAEFMVRRATAAQRAEAWLRVKGKWKE